MNLYKGKIYKLAKKNKLMLANGCNYLLNIRLLKIL